MKRVWIASALVAATLFVPTSAEAGVVPVATVTVINAATYDGDVDLELSICIDSVLKATDVPTGGGIEVELEAGGHEFQFFQGPDCSGTPFINEVLDIPAGDVTVMAYWSSEPTAVAFENDISCVEPDATRVTFRHGASMQGVDFFMTPSGGTEIEVATDVGPGEQGTSDIPAGEYTSSEIRVSGDPDVVLDTGAPGDRPTGVVTTVYFIGGSDGDFGWFVTEGNVPVCDQPTTTTTAATTTTTTGAAVVATPRFTG